MYCSSSASYIWWARLRHLYWRRCFNGMSYLYDFEFFYGGYLGKDLVYCKELRLKAALRTYLKISTPPYPGQIFMVRFNIVIVLRHICSTYTDSSAIWHEISEISWEFVLSPTMSTEDAGNVKSYDHDTIIYCPTKIWIKFGQSSTDLQTTYAFMVQQLRFVGERYRNNEKL